ncbi:MULTISPECIES: M42 family metallopeptidase [unclassified Fusibacter]|uniref:M42 family metallopeptidase n=1 Tax=unclassified Fusibacter TaxID=2624464 RepID=UPI001013732D|nr:MULTISPECIES: M42 family metallopeptidase [unclassified Fusibacter]MCK8060655.1 M42 family metallopeptidase [Fusibacter sp. A2]NPE22891.1 M42 family metallopeptidase [Fusibacter sp. A1]RXV59959.1 M42 family peptidase [Fusibacter sp. A1]
MGFNSSGLRALTNIYGPSSHETKVSDFIVKQIKGFVDEVTIDKMGNVIARKKGDGPKLMIAGHMDSIGMMVTDIDDKGFVRLTNIGGINPFVTVGERLLFKNGTIGIAYHEATADMAKLKLEKVFVDIGAKNKEEAEKLVAIGDICVYSPVFNESDNTVSTASMDDRIGCFVMIEALKRLDTVNNDCYFVFTVQEEVGTRGGKMTAFAINPDVGLAVDITTSGDTPGSKRFAIKLHEGVAIKVRDNSLLSHPAVNDKLKALCKENDIKHQMEVLEFGGTDAGAISLTREGIPASCLSIPTRYAHSAHETCSKEDIEAGIHLLTKVCETKFEI